MKSLFLLSVLLAGCAMPRAQVDELPEVPAPQINPDSLIYGVDGLCDYDEATKTYWFWGPTECTA